MTHLAPHLPPPPDLASHASQEVSSMMVKVDDMQEAITAVLALAEKGADELKKVK